MIPKTIHYCWFGGKPLPKMARRCLESWRKYCPDYEIVQWNESNFDLQCNPYVRFCYENGKWAYLSDYVRLQVVYDRGGVYFDTDVELISGIDKLLDNKAFFAFENEQTVATGLGFGAEKGNACLKSMMDQYAYEDGEEIRLTSCPALNTKALLPFGLRLDGSYQELDGVVILPVEYMNPYDDPTGRLTVTDKTISIHWYTKSALSKWSVFKSKLTRPLHRAFGVDCFRWLKGPR